MFDQEEALKFIESIVKSNPQLFMNALLACALGSPEEKAELIKAMKPLIEAIKHSSDYVRLGTGMAQVARHYFVHDGAPIEVILMATLTCGFVGGVQFILDGGQVKLPASHTASPPSAPLVN